MKNIKIFPRIFLSHALVGFLSVIVFSVIFYSILRDSLIRRTIDQLSSINILKKNQVDNYFFRTQRNLEFLVSHDLFLQPVIVSGPSAGRNNMAQLQGEIEAIRNLYDFERISIADSLGKEVWSTNGKIKDISEFFKGGSIDRKNFTIIDASKTSPSKSTILFYCMPFVMGNYSGYLVITENFQKIQKQLQETTGMGATGESYLVGNDFRMRSASRFFPERAPLDIEVRTVASAGSFTQQSDNHIIYDYRDKKVLSYYRRLDVSGLKWALISEIDFDEAMKPIVRLRNYLGIITLFIVLMIFIVTFFISNAISKPILYLKDVIIKLSKGVIPEQRPVAPNHDEIGQIADAIGQLISGMKRTTEFAYEIGSGNFDVAFTSLSEQDTLGAALIHMRDQLKNLNEREIRLVREKASALLEGQENERKRIIQELHDGVGQLLTAVRLRVEMLESDETLRREIMGLINETIAEVKRISYNVMPNAIVDFGLEAALKGLCENVKKYTSLTFDFRYVKEVDRKLNFEITIAVFRIAQEGLNNIIKHAAATHVELHVLDKEDELYMMIKDDGRGFDEERIFLKNGVGLRSIKERAKLLNGNAEIHSTPGMGTIIEMHIPTATN